MNGKLIWSIFWALVGVFAIEMGIIFIGVPNTYALFGGIGVLFGLGVALIVLAVKEKVGGMPRVFLLLTGASAAGMLTFALLHNLVYALFIYFFGEGFWGRIGGDEPVFFTMAIIICPIAFLVGAIGSIVIGVRESWLAKKSPSKARTKRKRA